MIPSTSNDFYSDFRNYAVNKMGISGYQFDMWEKSQDILYSSPKISASLTPMIIEESTMNMAQMSVFDKMANERLLFISGVVNERMALVTQAQLLYLDSLSNNDVTFYTNTPGGSVLSGLQIYDTMEYIDSDVSTINTGMCASMGSIILGAGTKGKRFSLPSARVMIHQVSSGASGHYEDMKISMAETAKYNEKLFKMLASFTGKTPEEVLANANRDMWLSAEEALAYGIIDGIITKKNGEIIKRNE